MITAVVAALLAMTAIAQQATLTINDERLHYAITFTAVSDDIVRVDVVPEGWNGDRLQTVACGKALNGRVPKVKILEDDHSSAIVTENGLSVKKMMNLIIVSHGGTPYLLDRIPGRDSTKVVLAHEPGESFYGAGERGYSFNLAGDTLVNYNTQNYGYQMGEKRTKLMGITMPFVISSKGYGVLFDDFCKSSLIVGDQELTYSSTSPQPISYYIIDGNGRVENVVKNFTWLTGRQELPPLWTLGYITSKYGYHDQRESEGVVDTLKREGYPLDGIVFDLYWYGKEEDMGRLEWDKQQWPDHRKMLRDFKEKGVNVVTISQPYVLTNGRAIDNYRLLDPQGLFCKTDGTDTTHTVTIWVGQGGMFDVSNPATRLWLHNRYKQLTDEGVTGWWGDLGEPEKHPLEIRHYNGLTAEQYHNYYGNEWSRIIYDMFKEEYPDRRPMVMMRAGTAGLQRYSVFPWSTDVSRSWGGMQPQVNIMLNTGLSGLGYMSHDVGGFAVDPANKRDGELYIRWLQLGLFSPMLRTHSTYQAEPYNYKEFGDLTLRIIKDRYKWLPYNYTLAFDNAWNGLPMVRPLGMYEDDMNFARYDHINDQYLWGRDVMVAPVMQQGAVSREITFPDGTWVDINHPEKAYQGHTTINYDAPIEVLPLFARAGAFIPQANYEMQNVGDYDPDRLDIVYYSSDNPSTYILFDDDLHSTGTLARDKHRLIQFTATPQGRTNYITIQGIGTIDGDTPNKAYRLIIPATFKPSKVTINGKKAKGMSYDKKSGTLTIPVTIPDVTATTIIEIVK
jgi:alpha-glucosidase (family GH31 glycosyl hydrolase)